MDKTFHSGFTQVPNEILDKHMSKLSSPELRVLLVILRQTVGFVNASGKQRKNKDWISRSFFIKKTSISPKSVSLAVAGLIDKGIIVATDKNGSVLKDAKMRKGRRRIYYAYAPYWYEYERNKVVKQITKKLRVYP